MGVKVESIPHGKSWSRQSVDSKKKLRNPARVFPLWKVKPRLASTETVAAQCSNCGTPLPDGVGEPLCPICALRGALELAEGDSFVPETVRYVGDYELLEQIARGGMGIVYRARQISLGRAVAIKMILAGHFASDEARTRFRAEAAAAARLQHPNIVAIHEVGESEGQPYFSMDYIEGRTLAELVRERPLAAKRAAGYVRTLAEAIHYAHGHGILHRDLKPSNVLIDAFDQPRITDFGLAKQTSGAGDLTTTGQVLGSPTYMPPEQALGLRAKISPASDVYALGAILYHLLTGRPPFHADTQQAILLQVQNDEPVAPRLLNASVPTDLETVCLKCLEKTPARRYATAQELAEDLGRFWRDESVLARPLGKLPKAWRWIRRHPAVAIMTAAVTVLLLAVAGVSTFAAVRIKRAERGTIASLRESLLVQARAVRLGGRPGQRLESLRALEQAMRLDASPEFRVRARNEAIASLALTDARFIPQPQLPPPFDATMGVFDPRLEFFACGEYHGLVTIHRATDGREIRRFNTRPRPIDHVLALSRDAGFLALRHGAEVGIWEAATGRLCVITNAYLRQFAFSSDSRRVAIAPSNGGLLICELPSGLLLRHWPAPSVNEEDMRGGFVSVAFSPDDRQLAIGRAAEPGIEIRDIDSGEALQTIPHSARVHSLAWSADGELVAGGCMDGSVLVWRAHSGLLVHRFEGHDSLVEALAFNPVGDRLASVSDDHTARFWNVANGQPDLALTTEGYTIGFGADGRHLGPAYQLGPMGWIEFITPRDFVSFRPAPKHDTACQATFSPDGMLIASLSYPGVCLWEARSRRLLARFSSTEPKYVRFHPRGDALLVSAQDRLERWPLRRTDAERLTVGPPERLVSGSGWQDVAFDRDGTRFLAANMLSSSATVWNSTSTAPPITLGPHEAAFTAALSPDGRWAATGSSGDRDVFVWDVSSAKLVQRFREGHNWHVAFSPDGRWLGTFRKTYQLWETGSWKPGPVLSLLKANLVGATAAFAPDSRSIACVVDEREIHLFSLPEAKLLAVLSSPNGARVRRLEFSPDGARLAAACALGEVQLWDLRQLHSSLAALRLDWEAPALPPANPAETKALRVVVIER